MPFPGRKNTARKKRMPELRFNTKIYKKKAIEEAISTYSHLARFKVRSNRSYINVRMDKVAPEFKNILADEFGNYVLGMTKKCL